jgi:hypothetical protein
MTVAQIMEEKKMRIPKPWVLKSEMADFLSQYKTNAAKKTAIGKEIKEQIYFITCLHGV